MTPLIPTLGFMPGTGDVVADLDFIMEFGLFVQGTSRSGKTNLVRVFLEQTYGVVQHFVIDTEGEYVTLRSPDRGYLVVGRGRDIELVPEYGAVRRLVRALIEKSVSCIFDLSEYDLDSDDPNVMGEQHVIVAAICDELVALPQTHPRNIGLVIEELQEFAGSRGGRATAHRPIRRLAKRGLKRGVFIIGSTQRTSDVSLGVVTQLKSKAIGGTDHDDAPRALTALGMPKSEVNAVSDLPQGQFWVKGPAFQRHAQLVMPSRSVTAPPKRRRGEAPTPAPEASSDIRELATSLAAQAATEPITDGAKLIDETGEVDQAAVEVEIARRIGLVREEFSLRQDRRFKRLSSILEKFDAAAAELRRMMELYSGEEVDRAA